MNNRARFLLSIGLLFVVSPAIAGPPADAGVTRTQIEGWENVGWQGGPQSSPKIICPGGELAEIPFPCSDSMTEFVHVRNGAGWSCVTSSDPRMTGLNLYMTNVNLDAESNGPVWGEYKLVPMVGCNKDGVYTDEYEELVKHATSFWHGTWNGQRQFDSDFNTWVSKIKIVGKGFGEDLDGLHFTGTEWITTFAPFPLPNEYIFPYGSIEFDMPEGHLIGTISD